MFTFFEAKNRRAGRTATSKLLAIVNHKVGNALFNDAKIFWGTEDPNQACLCCEHGLPAHRCQALSSEFATL